VSTSRYVRILGGPETPAKPAQVDPSPGGPIVEHLVAVLPTLGIDVIGHEDIQYAHELRCRVHGRPYSLLVSYDWVTGTWWEVFWPRTVGFFSRLLGRSEESELRTLALGVDEALESLPGIREKRWYGRYGTVTDNTPYAAHPAS
jgi:hypothetical protein